MRAVHDSVITRKETCIEDSRERDRVFNHNLGAADKNESFLSINANVSANFNYTWRF
jgi:hypothetical protein